MSTDWTPLPAKPPHSPHLLSQLLAGEGDRGLTALPGGTSGPVRSGGAGALLRLPPACLPLARCLHSSRPATFLVLQALGCRLCWENVPEASVVLLNYSLERFLPGAWSQSRGPPPWAGARGTPVMSEDADSAEHRAHLLPGLWKREQPPRASGLLFLKLLHDSPLVSEVGTRQGFIRSDLPTQPRAACEGLQLSPARHRQGSTALLLPEVVTPAC